MITIGDAIEDTCRQLEASDVFYGHGTDNPWDEAVQLVLAACSLPADSDRSVIEQPVGEAESGQIERWLRERISKHVPLPYLTGKAWFAGIEFLSDARALVPRSPLAAVIQSARVYPFSPACFALILPTQHHVMHWPLRRNF